MGIGTYRGYRQQNDDEEENDVEQLQPLEDPEEANQADEEQNENNGLFFNARAGFFFGGGRFLSGDDIFMRPEDVAYLQGPLRSMTPPVEKTVTVKSPVNLNKRSLQLKTTEEDGIYDLEFTFDSVVDCVISVFYKAKETRDKKTQQLIYTSAISPSKGGNVFKAGIGQSFRTDAQDQLDISLFASEKEQNIDDEQKVYPVVITIEAAGASGVSFVNSQTTIAKLYKCSDNTFEIKTVKQRVQYRGMSYLVHDIFGIDEARETSEECVVCITNPRNTVVIPCRHMCLCHECAEALRYQTNKCPICRGAVRSLLKIEISKVKPQTSVLHQEKSALDAAIIEGGEDEPDIKLIKRPKKKKASKLVEPLAIEEPITSSQLIGEA